MKNRFGKRLPKGWPNHIISWGYRVTTPRKIIIQILNNTDKHLSAEDIFTGLKNIPYYWANNCLGDT